MCGRISRHGRTHSIAKVLQTFSSPDTLATQTHTLTNTLDRLAIKSMGEAVASLFLRSNLLGYGIADTRPDAFAPDPRTGRH